MIEEIEKDSERKKANSKLIYFIERITTSLHALVKTLSFIFIFIF